MNKNDGRGATAPGSLWKSDEELFQIARKELYTAVIGDIMDKMGLLHQFLQPQIQPLEMGMFVVGRAMTVLEADMCADVDGVGHNAVLKKPFGLMLHALDDLKPDEVYVCAGASPTYALWGELMSTRASILGAAGAVVNGYSRDTRGMLAVGLPVFSYGNYAQDQAPRGKVIDFRVPLKMGEVLVNPGDVVVGDVDGVCIVPSGAVREVFSLAIEKARGEKFVQVKIREGMSAQEAFAAYGIM